MPDPLEDEEEQEQPTEEQLASWAQDTQNVMSKCSLSQPYEDGDAVWLNDHGSLTDALEMACVPEAHHEAVAQKVRCPCCNGIFELHEEVGLKSLPELRFGELRRQWLHEHRHRLDAFYAHLENYPYLESVQNKQVSEKLNPPHNSTKRWCFSALAS